MFEAVFFSVVLFVAVPVLIGHAIQFGLEGDQKRNAQSPVVAGNFRR